MAVLRRCAACDKPIWEGRKPSYFEHVVCPCGQDGSNNPPWHWRVRYGIGRLRKSMRLDWHVCPVCGPHEILWYCRPLMALHVTLHHTGLRRAFLLPRERENANRHRHRQHDPGVPGG